MVPFGVASVPMPHLHAGRLAAGAWSAGALGNKDAPRQVSWTPWSARATRSARPSAAAG